MQWSEEGLLLVGGWGGNEREERGFENSRGAHLNSKDLSKHLLLNNIWQHSGISGGEDLYLSAN